MNKPTPSRPPPDAPARLRIVTELDRNLLVEAGAGSGKTHELAARMAAGIANGTYELERMAAVTFTRKAAAELRGRFQLALETELAAYAGRTDSTGQTDLWSAEPITRLRTALANLERFFAGTIHAFCARLLRERPDHPDTNKTWGARVDQLKNDFLPEDTRSTLWLLAAVLLFMSQPALRIWYWVMIQSSLSETPSSRASA
jgi:ATP-dependent helicase/nuclease subunit A